MITMLFDQWSREGPAIRSVRTDYAPGESVCWRHDHPTYSTDEDLKRRPPPLSKINELGPKDCRGLVRRSRENRPAENQIGAGSTAPFFSQ